MADSVPLEMSVQFVRIILGFHRQWQPRHACAERRYCCWLKNDLNETGVYDLGIGLKGVGGTEKCGIFAIILLLRPGSLKSTPAGPGPTSRTQSST